MHFLTQLSNPHYATYLALLTENNRFTYQELDQLTNACAILFLNQGISAGSMLLLCFQNQALQFIASIAALKIGACHLGLQAGGSLDKKQQLALQAKVNYLISDFSLALTCNKLEINFQTLKHYVNNNPKCSPKIPNFSNSNFALIVPGSGTTGISKLIAIDFTNLNKLISRDLIERTIQEKEHHLSFTPVEFYTAKRRNFSCLQAGACVVMRENFNTTLFQFLKNNTIEHISLASSHAKDLMQGDTNLTKQLFLKTKTVFLGGSPISEKLRENFRHHITDNLVIAYGTNEIGECCIANSELQKRFENCVGFPLAGVTIEVVDKEGKILNNNSIGLLRIKTDGMYSAYLNHNNSQHNAAAAQWFYPGDYGLLTDEGVLILKGRSDDVITYHGTMIYPREIEQLLEAIAEVNDVAAFALDVEDNQIPAVVFTASRTLNIQNINTYLKNKLGWLSPQFIRQMKELPKNDAGKILKREIKQQIMQELYQQKN